MSEMRRFVPLPAPRRRNKSPAPEGYRASPWPVSTVVPPLNLAACLLTAKELETMDIPSVPKLSWAVSF